MDSFFVSMWVGIFGLMYFAGALGIALFSYAAIRHVTVRVGQVSCNVWRKADLEPFTGFSGGMLLASGLLVSALNLGAIHVIVPVAEMCNPLRVDGMVAGALFAFVVTSVGCMDR